MTRRHEAPTPVVRHCPLCGIAMQASKSRKYLAHDDTFQCQICHTTIVEASPRPARRAQDSGK